LISNPTRELEKAFETLESLDEDCFRWILGGKPGTRKVDSHARGLIGVSTLRMRFLDLHTMFTAHLKDISRAGTELNAVSEKIRSEFISTLPSLLPRLLKSQPYRAYQKKAQAWKASPSDWTIDGIIAKSWENQIYPDNPPTLKTHLRLHRQVEHRKSSAMMSLVRDDCRVGNKLGMDSSLFIPLASIRAFAIQWRLNHFSHRYQCPVHKRPMTRSCVHQCHLVDDCQEISIDQWTRFELSEASYERDPRGKKASCFTILDDLLNFKEWKTFAFVLLFLLRKAHQARNHSSTAGTIDKIESDLEKLLGEQVVYSLAIPTSSSSELLVLDNG
jgi:hypothetical protein